MEKLTLSIDPVVIARAKRYAKARGTSVSRLVEQMLDLASSGAQPAPAARASHTATAEPPPVLARLRGSMKRGTVDDYKAYLARKHR